MTGFLDPVTLQGRHVRLEPLTAAHVEPLCRAAGDGELWKLWYTSVPAQVGMASYVQAALAMHEEERGLPFAVRLLATDEIVGSTRFCNADTRNRRLEIGYTWYAARVQRTAVNSECKWLLLHHAFETLGCIAVEFRTHWFNRQSRAAIERLGAKQDGVLRNHQRLADGSYRDTVVYSIVESEWPAVKRHLSFRLEQGARAASGAAP